MAPVTVRKPCVPQGPYSCLYKCLNPPLHVQGFDTKDFTTRFAGEIKVCVGVVPAVDVSSSGYC